MFQMVDQPCGIELCSANAYFESLICCGAVVEIVLDADCFAISVAARAMTKLSKTMNNAVIRPLLVFPLSNEFISILP